MKKDARLLTTQSSSLAETESRIAASFADASGTDFGLTFALRQLEDGRNIVARTTPAGPDGSADCVPAFWKSLDLTELPPFWLPDLPVRHHVNALQPMWGIYTEADRQRLPQIDQLYFDHGLHDAVRILVYDGPRFAGYIGGKRFFDRPRFTRDEVTSLRCSVRPFVESIIALDRRRRSGANAPAHAVFRPDGTLESASAAGRPWMTPLLRDRVVHRIGRLERGEDAFEASDALSIVRLEGDGPHRYLVNLPSSVAPFIRGAAALTPRQRQVAELVAVGASGREVAEHLGISVHTVRQHVKGAYRLLGVANRIELAEALNAPLASQLR